MAFAAGDEVGRRWQPSDRPRRRAIARIAAAADRVHTLVTRQQDQKDEGARLVVWRLALHVSSASPLRCLPSRLTGFEPASARTVEGRPAPTSGLTRRACTTVVQRVCSVSSSIHAAARSAIISVGALVLPLVMVGITLASATRSAGHAVHAQARVDHRHRVVGAAHLAGADRVEDRGADVAGQARQFVVALVLHAGLDLARRVRAPAPAARRCGASGAATRRPPGGRRRCDR